MTKGDKTEPVKVNTNNFESLNMACQNSAGPSWSDERGVKYNGTFDGPDCICILNIYITWNKYIY